MHHLWHLNVQNIGEEIVSIRRIKIDSKKLALKIASIAKDRKAEEPLVLDMRKVSSFCDYFVILSGNSLRHTKALADAIEKDLEKDGIKPLVNPPKGETPWVALDFTDVVVHIFHEPVRQFYSLERLWQDAPHVRIPKKKNERKKPR